MGMNIQELLALDFSEHTWIRILPHSLASLVRLIEVEPTLRLALEYGGTTVYVPKSPWTDKSGTPSGLIDIVGEAAAVKLCKEFGPSNMPVPSFLHARFLRRVRWLALMDGGATEREATQSAGISKTTHYAWKQLYLEPAK